MLLTAVAILFIRNQVRAIERLADAAEAFGKGADVAASSPTARSEVRQAAHAFLAMKNRIQRHVDQRTTLLASVSHDLRTPLTRLKLELALAEPGARVEAMKRDLAEMEHMIDEYLAFARGEGGEALERVDVRAAARARSAKAPRGPGAEVRGRRRRRPRRHRAPQRHQARAVQPGDERRRATASTSRSPPARRRPAGWRSSSTTTAPAFRRSATRRRSRRSAASTRPATRTTRASASASPSPATSPAATAAR